MLPLLAIHRNAPQTASTFASLAVSYRLCSLPHFDGQTDQSSSAFAGHLAIELVGNTLSSSVSAESHHCRIDPIYSTNLPASNALSQQRLSIRGTGLSLHTCLLTSHIPQRLTRLFHFHFFAPIFASFFSPQIHGPASSRLTRFSATTCP